jgi:SNF2 family DNA or RNA helicase
LQEAGLVKRVLVVAPLSTLWDVWETEIFTSFPLRTFCVLHGDRKKRLELLTKPHDFYIVNHHGVPLIEAALRDRPDIDLVVLDEASIFRNSRTALWKSINQVVNGKVTRSVWALTGTPTPNEPTDAFGLCKLITPENLAGRHFTSFKHETMLQLAQYKWVPRKEAAEIVAKVLKPAICFERTVCTDLEPCFIERRAEMSDEQKKAYSQLKNQASSEVRGSTVTAINAAVLLSKLTQVACGVVIAADGTFVRMDFGPRLGVLKELIEENTEKVLVFVPFTGALDAVASELSKTWSVAVVDGSVSAAKRTQIFRDFRTLPDPHILVCHPQTMAHGLDLTAATLSIWYAPYCHAEYYQQANARTDGSKQTVKIDIACIYSTPEEKRIYSVLGGKGRFQDVVLELAKKS